MVIPVAPSLELQCASVSKNSEFMNPFQAVPPVTSIVCPKKSIRGVITWVDKDGEREAVVVERSTTPQDQSNSGQNRNIG